MSRLSSIQKGVWLLPIVLVVCALMVLPGASVFGAGQGAASSGASAGASPSLADHGAATSSPTGPLSEKTNPSYASSLMQQLSGAAAPGVGAAANSLAYGQALGQIASTPGLRDAGALANVANAIRNHQLSPSSVYLPNLNLLASGPQPPGSPFGVGYVTNPAPMGIGDFGWGSSGAYSYNSSHIQGSTTLLSGNATYPGADYYITPPGNTYGSYNTPYEFGIQLNTVTTNVSVPGGQNGVFWVQNVVALNGNILQFENNIWNWSNVAGIFNASSIISGNGGVHSNAVYYYYGPVITLTFPVTINLYNNLSVVNGRDQVEFGYRVVDGAGTFTGVYDTVVFNSTLTPSSPKPEFEVSGQTLTPIGLHYDSELILGGPGGGSNAVFNNITGSESLSYSNLTSGGWQSVPSAYDFGADTGETAIGVAETWSPGGTVGLSTGPSILYGLWNSQPSTAVPSGSIEVQGTLTPSYGFLFMDRDTPFYYNASYMPTTINGGFETYLPPGTYDLVYIADGYGWTYITFTGANTGLALTLTAGKFNAAPLYIDGDAQAQAAAAAIVGWSSGPISFQGQSLLWGLQSEFFNHLNDWGYVTFNEFQATDVTDVLNVTDMTQGTNNLTAAGSTNYWFDGLAVHATPTLLSGEPELSSSLGEYGNLIAFYSDPSVQLSSEEFQGYMAGSSLDTSGYYNLNPAGGGAVLWNSPNAEVGFITASQGTYGVVVAGSPGLSFFSGLSALGANALSLQGSSNAKVTDVTGEFSVAWTNHEGAGQSELSFGVYDLDSQGGTFRNIVGAYGGYGLADFGGTGAVVNSVTSIFESTNISGGLAIGVYLDGAVHTSVNDTLSEYDSIGVEALGTLGTTLTNTTADGLAFSPTYAFLVGDGADWTNITHTLIEDTDYGARLVEAYNTTITSTTIYDVDYGVYFSFYNYDTTFNGLYMSYVLEEGVQMEGSVNTAYSNVYLDHDYIGVLGYGNLATTMTTLVVNSTNTYGFVDEYSSSTSVMGLTSIGVSLGFYAIQGSTISVNTALVEDASTEGILYYEVDGGSVAKLTSTDLSNWGFVAQDSSDITVSQVTVSDESGGVEIDPSTSVTISGVSVTGDSVGNVIVDSSSVSITGTTSTDSSLGDVIEDSTQVTDTKGVTSDNSTAVAVLDSSFTTVSDVTASATTQYNVFSTIANFGVPLTAVYTEDTTTTTVVNVTSTEYGASLYDIESTGLQATNINGTNDQYAVVLNGTYYSNFDDIGAYHDYIGLVALDYSTWAEENVITGSSFVDDTSYGVAFLGGEYNTVTMNNFIGDNGATSTYSSAHIQAWAVYYNDFSTCTNDDCSTGVGNYWADWHTFGSNGFLAPYLVNGETWDYFPLGPQETFAVNFNETGLPSGTDWSVTYGGMTLSSTGTTVTFPSTMGTYTFQVGTLAGWTATPASGSVTVAGAAYNVSVTFAQSTYAVTLSAGGLSAGTTWSATVNGVTQSTSGTSLVFYLPTGAYAYSFNSVSGYNLPSTGASGSVTVSGAPTNLAVTYSPSSTPSTVSSSTYNTGFAIAIAIAVIALLLALLALLWRGKTKSSGTPPPAAWTPPAGTAASPPAGGAADSSQWSEGTGSPPS
jgi:hypothetical protein